MAEPLRRPWWAWCCAVAVLVLLVWPEPIWPPWNLDAVTWMLAVAALVVAGWQLLGTADQRRNGGLMVMEAALVAGQATLSGFDAGPGQQLAFVLYPMTAVPLAALLLRWPYEHLRTRADVWLVRCGWIATVGLGLADALTWDPAWRGYHGAAWWLTLVHIEALHTVITTAKGVVFLALLIGLLVLLSRRWRRAPRPQRRSLVPVVLSAVAWVTAQAIDQVAWIADVPAVVPNVLGNLSLLVLPLSVLVSLVVRRIQRALAVEALLDPTRLLDAAAVRAALGRALGDRHLTLELWSQERKEFVALEGSGDTVHEPGRLAVEVTSPDGAALARLGVDPRLADSADLVEAVTRAASVALENARLLAELAARRRAVEESSAALTRAENTERSLSRLVPAGLAERLRDDPEALMRTERLTVTVLMSDIRGFSGIAETTPPAALAEQLNEHRRAMNAAILGAGGTVMQYVGDAVLAVFGAPHPEPGHQDRALGAAAGMHVAQDRLNRAWAQQGLPPFGLGIGLSTGEVAAAFLGSEEHIEYTLVGDTVNLAARLTDAARPAGTTVALAATVAGARGSWHAVALPPFPVKGRTASVSACRVLFAAAGGESTSQPQQAPADVEGHRLLPS